MKYFSKHRFSSHCQVTYAITSVPVSTRHGYYMDIYLLSLRFITREVGCNSGSRTMILWDNGSTKPRTLIFQKPTDLYYVRQEVII